MRKTILQALARTKADFTKQNKAFAKMNRANKRVHIAQDVLKLLDTGALEAQTGFYLSMRHIPKKDRDTDLANLLGKEQNCQACGIGAVFVASVMRKDELPAADFLPFNVRTVYDSEPSERDLMTAYTKKHKLFTTDEMHQIEELFERRNHFLAGEDAYDWTTPKERLQECMNFFIATKGRRPFDIAAVANHISLLADLNRAILKKKQEKYV